MDVDGIDWCDVVVACMDGPDPDSGTCWECGYAYRKKKIICYRTDFRSATEHAAVGQDMDAPVKGLAPFNLMLSESADVLVLSLFSSLNDLASNLCYELDCIKEPCWMCKDEAKAFVEMAAYEYALHNRRVVCPVDLRCHKCRRVVHYGMEPVSICGWPIQVSSDNSVIKRCKNERPCNLHTPDGSSVSTIECIECPKPAAWVRHTQFAGDHPFCDNCAKKEADFGQSDPIYWEKMT
jgi:hypothetical protein